MRTEQVDRDDLETTTDSRLRVAVPMQAGRCGREAIVEQVVFRYKYKTTWRVDGKATNCDLQVAI